MLNGKLAQYLARLLLALLVFVPGCSVKRVTTPTTLTTDNGLEQDYRQATSLALNPTPEKIYDELVAIVPDNTSIVWKEIEDQPYVLMVSSTSSFSYYEDYVGKTYNTGSYDMWVTASPYVQELCQDPAWSDGDLSLRIEQLLGLPPGGGRVGFVELWVRPQDLFRPCPDNEITDRTCDLAMPPNVEGWYRKWFNELRAQQYYFCSPDKNGYPWTQLGYTFDWKDLNNYVGMSEFVVKRNADVIIKALVPTAEYCNPK